MLDALLGPHAVVIDVCDLPSFPPCFLVIVLSPPSLDAIRGRGGGRRRAGDPLAQRKGVGTVKGEWWGLPAVSLAWPPCSSLRVAGPLAGRPHHTTRTLSRIFSAGCILFFNPNSTHLSDTAVFNSADDEVMTVWDVCTLGFYFRQAWHLFCLFFSFLRTPGQVSK